MHNIVTFHHKNMVAAEHVGIMFKADLFKSVPMIIGFCCHAQHWSVSLQESGSCRNRWFFYIRTDLFKSVPMITSFCCHEQHWDVSTSVNGCCRKRWFQIRSRPLQISTINHRLWLSWTSLRHFRIRNNCCRNRWFHIRSRPFWINTDHLKRCLS